MFKTSKGVPQQRAIKDYQHRRLPSLYSNRIIYLQGSYINIKCEKKRKEKKTYSRKTFAFENLTCTHQSCKLSKCEAKSVRVKKNDYVLCEFVSTKVIL